MISPILSRIYMINLEKKISLWLDINDKKPKCQVGFRRYHSTTNHLVTLKMIEKECHNNKIDLLRGFIDFRKYFDTILMKKLSNWLEKIKVPIELRVYVKSLFENLIAKFRTTKGLP